MANIILVQLANHVQIINQPVMEQLLMDVHIIIMMLIMLHHGIVIKFPFNNLLGIQIPVANCITYLAGVCTVCKEGYAINGDA